MHLRKLKDIIQKKNKVSRKRYEAKVSSMNSLLVNVVGTPPPESALQECVVVKTNHIQAKPNVMPLSPKA